MQTSAHISPCSPAKHNTSFSCFFLKTIVDCCGYTLSLSLSTTTIRNVPLTFFQAKEFEIGILFFEVLSWNTLQFCAQLTVTTSSCYYQFPCFLYNKTFSRTPEKKSKRYPAVYRRTHRQTERDTYPPCGDRGGCNNGFASSIHMIPEMYVTFPLPYPSSPASWTLLLPLSIQDSHNISSNDRYHHSLSSLDNNKTGIYLSICLFIYWFIYNSFICKSIKSVHHRKGAAREELIPE